MAHYGEKENGKHYLLKNMVKGGKNLGVAKAIKVGKKRFGSLNKSGVAPMLKRLGAKVSGPKADDIHGGGGDNLGLKRVF